MNRRTPTSMTRALGRRAAQITLAGAVAATPLLFTAGTASATDWDAVAQCESGGNWSTDTGNGFSGGLQFTPSTWKAYGGSGSPEGASRSEQIAVAERVKAGQGMGAWPVCGSRGGSGSSSSSGSSDSGSSESSSSESSGSSEQAATSTTGSAASEAGSYTVRSGDTLSGIAADHGVSGGASALASKNGITDPNMIMPGQQLTLS